MKKDNKVFLEHILESIEFIENYINDLNKNDFLDSTEKQDAIIRRLEIIGEAVKNLSDDFKNITLYIPWRDIADFRNVLIHEYFGINGDLVWQVIKKDIPNLKKEIKILLK
ncbi:MAG: DUF86 domain-containing protein [Patescibacteria group bacterium]